MREDEEIKSKILMADDGYGFAEVNGVIDGEEKKISTSDNPISSLAPTDDENPETILEALSNKIQKLFNRFVK